MGWFRWLGSQDVWLQIIVGVLLGLTLSAAVLAGVAWVGWTLLTGGW